MSITITLRRASVLGCAAAALMAAACSGPAPSAVPRTRQIVQLNQGWSEREAQFYAHASEGTNLAPLEFVLNLPDPAARGSRFVDKLADYGFIPSARSRSNPHALPVGFAIDDRPARFGDRPYVGITCSACHTRQLTYSTIDASGQASTWILPVHGGPGLVDIPRFTGDLYDAFFALLDDDALAGEFARGVLGRAPGTEEIAALRREIREFTEPVGVTRSILGAARIARTDFGPGNLNALSRGTTTTLG